MTYNSYYVSKADFNEIHAKTVELIEIKVKTRTPWKPGAIR